MSKKSVSWKFHPLTGLESEFGGLLFDSTFFSRKAQALFRFADIVNEPAFEGRLRENAARCHSQAMTNMQTIRFAPSVKQSTAN